jgi:hypothetical protein
MEGAAVEARVADSRVDFGTYPKLEFPPRNLRSSIRMRRLSRTMTAGVLVMIGATIVPALICNAALAAATPAYALDLAATPATQTSIDSFLSINTTGTVAFVASDKPDGLKKVFVSPTCPQPPCSPSPISFFSSGRFFNGASINNANPPLVLSEDSYGGSYFLRSWQVTTPGSFALVASSSPSGFAAFNGIHGLADNGATVALGLVQPTFQPSLAFFNSPQVSTNDFPFSSGTLLRPQMARGTGDTVATIPVGTDKETVVYQSPSQAVRYVAGASLGFSNLGANPAISDDGLAVGFYGTLAGANQIYVNVGDKRSNCTKPASDCIIADLVTEGQEGVTSLAAAATGILGVYSRRGGTFKDVLGMSHYYQLVTVAFPATVTSGSGTAAGVYTRDLLLDARLPTSASTAPTLRVVAKGSILPVVSTGTEVGGVTLAGNFVVGGALAASSVGNAKNTNADTRLPYVALSASDAQNNQYVVRGARMCAVPASSSLSRYSQTEIFWSKDILGFGTSSLKSSGCLLTDVTNVLGYFEPQIARAEATGLTPGNVNKLLKGDGFSVDGSGRIAMPGQLHVLGGFSAKSGNLVPTGVEQLSRFLGHPLDSFQLQVSVASDGSVYKFAQSGGALTGNPPPTDPNVNGEDLSPVNDFFLCNQQPVTQLVINCTSATSCHQHFVVDKAKSAIPVKGQSGSDTTYLINDPGYANNTPTDLINVFTNGTNLLNRRNRVVGIRAYTDLPHAGMGNDRFSIVTTALVTVLLTDPQGRKVGIDPSTKAGVSMIPNASYVQTNLSDPSGAALNDADVELAIGSPLNADGQKTDIGDGALDGQYTLTVTGVAAGTYSLTYVNIDAGGKLETATVTRGTTAGHQDTYKFVRNPSGSTPPTLSPP